MLSAAAAIPTVMSAIQLVRHVTALTGFTHPAGPTLSPTTNATAETCTVSTPEDCRAEPGPILPATLQLRPGATQPFPWIRVAGSSVIISGHGPTNMDGNLTQPSGNVGLGSWPGGTAVRSALKPGLG